MPMNAIRAPGCSWFYRDKLCKIFCTDCGVATWGEQRLDGRQRLVAKEFEVVD